MQLSYGSLKGKNTGNRSRETVGRLIPFCILSPVFWLQDWYFSNDRTS